MEIVSSKGIRDQIMNSESLEFKYDALTIGIVEDYISQIFKNADTTSKRHWWLSGKDIMEYWPEIKDLDKNKIYMVEL